MYGEVYVFLPFNGFKHIWSQDVMDLYVSTIGMHEYHLDSFIESYQNDQLPKAIKIGNEIMFKCKAYYILNMKFQWILDDYLKKKKHPLMKRLRQL